MLRDHATGPPISPNSRAGRQVSPPFIERTRQCLRSRAAGVAARRQPLSHVPAALWFESGVGSRFPGRRPLPAEPGSESRRVLAVLLLYVRSQDTRKPA